MVVMAVVMLMTALSGCTSTSNPPVVQVVSTPTITYTPSPAPVVTIVPVTSSVPEADSAAIADKKFVDAIATCYSQNPVIANISAQMAFVSCMQNTPDPRGVCALNYKNNILKYTKEDDTTAGYQRENMRIQRARDAYSRNLSYNYLNDQDEACGQLPMGYPI